MESKDIPDTICKGQEPSIKRVIAWGAGTALPTKPDANSTFIWGPIPEMNNKGEDDSKTVFVWG